MALINCPECAKYVSDKATTCPNCGFPIREHVEKQQLKEEIEDMTVEEIRCSYCNSIDIDNDGYCNDCGMKIANHKEENLLSKKVDYSKVPHTVCPKCGHKNESGKFTCEKCMYKYKMNDYHVIIPKEDLQEDKFDGVYRYDLFSGKQEVYCPRCNSHDCSHYKEQKIIPAKTKITYSANLNPLKPFTLINKKEKVIRRGQAYTENKFICNKCGKIFY